MPVLPGRTTKEEHNRGPVIVISGAPGSGKSTYARRLSRELGLRYYTSGQAFRELARRLGVSLEELSRVAERDPSIDISIDLRVLDEARRGGVVIDSHLAGWVLAGMADVSILVKAGLLARLRRVAAREGTDIGEVMVQTLTREMSQWRRYKEYYGYDTMDYSVFDLVLDTSVLGVEESYEIIRSFVVLKLRALGWKKLSRLTDL